ncbi:MAG: hypothetical protein ACRDZ3_02180 [Acidimicrobiia bacterium]
MARAESNPEAFVAALSEWVEACWFDEREATGRRLDAVLAFPPDVVLAGSLAVLARLVDSTATPAAEVADALAQHLVVSGPDPGRQALIREVVLAAGSPVARAELLARRDPGAVTRTALECASYLSQVLAEREGVVPSSILRDL